MTSFERSPANPSLQNIAEGFIQVMVKLPNLFSNETLSKNDLTRDFARSVTNQFMAGDKVPAQTLMGCPGCELLKVYSPDEHPEKMTISQKGEDLLQVGVIGCPAILALIRMVIDKQITNRFAGERLKYYAACFSDGSGEV